MPFGDGTGPYGTGPVGRGMGPCGGGFAGRRGYAFGPGTGYRRFWGPGWPGPFPGLTPEEEKAQLEQRKNWLQSVLDAVIDRLDTLNKPNSS
jgi:hypothetical protein